MCVCLQQSVASFRRNWCSCLSFTLENEMFRFFQVDDLQEEKNRIRQLFGERGSERGHLLIPPNDRGGRKQLGHLKKTAARSERTQSQRGRCDLVSLTVLGLPVAFCTDRLSISWRSCRAETLPRLEVSRTLVSKETRWRCVSWEKKKKLPEMNVYLT